LIRRRITCFYFSFQIPDGLAKTNKVLRVTVMVGVDNMNKTEISIEHPRNFLRQVSEIFASFVRWMLLRCWFWRYLNRLAEVWRQWSPSPIHPSLLRRIFWLQVETPTDLPDFPWTIEQTSVLESMFVSVPTTYLAYFFRSIRIRELLVIPRIYMVCDVNCEATYDEILAPKHYGATSAGTEIISNLLTCSPILSPVGRPLFESPDQWIPGPCAIME
jgi:hypothetical protein